MNFWLLAYSRKTRSYSFLPLLRNYLTVSTTKRNKLHYTTRTQQLKARAPQTNEWAKQHALRNKTARTIKGFLDLSQCWRGVARIQRGSLAAQRSHVVCVARATRLRAALCKSIWNRCGPIVWRGSTRVLEEARERVQSLEGPVLDVRGNCSQKT